MGVDQVAAFNALAEERLRADLLACCAAPAWGDVVLAGRPYPDRAAILAAGERAGAGLSWADVEAGLAAHPRIGERAVGDSREAAWSRREQSSDGEQDPVVADGMAAANEAYEKKFERVFLIFASGRSRAEMLAAATERLGNDEATERVVVAGELAKIASLRLARLLDGL